MPLFESVPVPMTSLFAKYPVGELVPIPTLPEASILNLVVPAVMGFPPKAFDCWNVRSP